MMISVLHEQGAHWFHLLVRHITERLRGNSQEQLESK